MPQTTPRDQGLLFLERLRTRVPTPEEIKVQFGTKTTTPQTTPKETGTGAMLDKASTFVERVFGAPAFLASGGNPVTGKPLVKGGGSIPRGFSEQVTEATRPILGKAAPVAGFAAAIAEPLPGPTKLKKVADVAAKLPAGVAKISKWGVQVKQEFADFAKSIKDFGSLESSGISMLDPIRAAEKLDGSSNGLIKRTLIDPLLEADDVLIKDSQKYAKRISEFAGNLKSGSKEDQLIRRYGEREVYPENFSKVDEGLITPRIERAAEEFRVIYDELLEKINASRVKAGQPLVPRRTDYFTHAEDLGVLTSIFGDVSKIPGAMLRAAPYTKPNSAFFKFALPRLLSKSNAGAVEGFERYLQAALPTIHYTDPILNLRAHVPFLPPQASKYFDQWASELAGKKAALDRPFPDEMLKIADKFRTLTSKGSILGNLSTVFLQPSSLASTISRAGAFNTLKSIPQTFSNKGIALAEEFSKTLRARQYDPDINPATLKKFERVLGWGIQTFDRMMVRNAFLAGLKAATKQGMNFEEAVKFADDIARKTQASNRKILQPPLMRSKVGGVMGQLQTFTINLYNQIRRDLPLIRKESGTLEALKAAMTLGISAIVINQLYEEVGLPQPYNITTFLPLSGSARFGEPTPALAGAWGALQTIVGIGSGQAEITQEGLKDLKRFLTTTVPGGRQAVKTLQGVVAIMEGGSRTPDGKLRFPIQGFPEELRALLFGPYQTKAGQKFIENQGKKKEPSLRL